MKGAPKGWTGTLEEVYSSEEGWAFHRHMAKKLAQKGWLARAWPKEYGGESAPILEQLLFSESAGYHFAPGIDIFGIGMIGPTLLVYGNEEQKREHLSPIARGEQMWCQLWSEPNAGSDLAALKTTARRDGNVYILNGQKIWTSGAHRADWGFGVFRTDPAQKGSKGGRLKKAHAGSTRNSGEGWPSLAGSGLSCPSATAGLRARLPTWPFS